MEILDGKSKSSPLDRCSPSCSYGRGSRQRVEHPVGVVERAALPPPPPAASDLIVHGPRDPLLGAGMDLLSKLGTRDKKLILPHQVEDQLFMAVCLGALRHSPLAGTSLDIPA